MAASFTAKAAAIQSLSIGRRGDPPPFASPRSKRFSGSQDLRRPPNPSAGRIGAKVRPSLARFAQAQSGKVGLRVAIILAAMELDVVARRLSTPPQQSASANAPQKRDKISGCLKPPGC